MNYHKMASFWILISNLFLFGYFQNNSTTFGLLFSALLFALELSFKFKFSIKELELTNSKKEEIDPELKELQLESQKENLRASIDVTRRQRALQDSMLAGKKTDKKDWSW